ncbi:MAG TPA: hypothetical protein VNG33_12160 [Polyangiaceae bacterium]|nr:hypothetical protein [Polyangiaceae bacterium]
MKKKANKRPGRRGTSWSEVSSINFGDYQLKQNRFAKRVKKEGILLVHDSPSPASLKAVPEADFGRVRVRRSNYAERIKTGGLTLQVGRGRPRGGAETGPTVLKSVRLPPSIWKELEKRARAEGVAVHALVRKAILALLRSAA